MARTTRKMRRIIVVIKPWIAWLMRVVPREWCILHHNKQPRAHAYAIGANACYLLHHAKKKFQHFMEYLYCNCSTLLMEVWTYLIHNTQRSPMWSLPLSISDLKSLGIPQVHIILLDLVSRISDSASYISTSPTRVYKNSQTKHLWNVGKLLPHYTAQYPRREP